MIVISDITKRFEKRTVLEHVSLALPNRCIIGLYGESGSGKSTFAKILCGLLSVDEGKVEGNGNVQMVSQQPTQALDPKQRIIDGVRELIRYHKMAKREERESLIRGMCDKVGLSRDILNHYPHQISGGEAQRIAVMKALLFRPDLLIFDEATQMLDVSTQANLLAMVKRERNESYQTLLFISHDKALVRSYCDVVYLINNKNIKEVDKDEW